MNSTFLNGILNEEVYLEQPRGLKTHVNMITYTNWWKLSMNSNKHQEIGMTSYLLGKGYARGGADRMLFIRWENNELTTAYIYVGGIVFG